MPELIEEEIEYTECVRRCNLPEVEGWYELTASWALVQAVGSCLGVNFYLRAKYGEWEFTTEDRHGHPYPEGDGRYVLLSDCYDEQKPGAMGIEWATRLLRCCLAEWWGLRTAGSGPCASRGKRKPNVDSERNQ